MNGDLTVAADLTVNANVTVGGDVRALDSTDKAIFNTTADGTTLYTGTITIGSPGSTLDIPGSLNVGAGYGGSGATVDTNGNLRLNGALTVDQTATLTGDLTVGGDVLRNGNTADVNVFTHITGGGAFTQNVAIGGSATTVKMHALHLPSTGAATIILDGSTGKITCTDLEVDGDIVATTNEAKSIFTTVTGSITMGGGTSTVVVQNLKVNTGFPHVAVGTLTNGVDQTSLTLSSAPAVAISDGDMITISASGTGSCSIVPKVLVATASTSTASVSVSKFTVTDAGNDACQISFKALGDNAKGSTLEKDGDASITGNLEVAGNVTVLADVTIGGDIISGTAGEKSIYTSDTVTIGSPTGTVEIPGTVEIAGGYGVSNGITISANNGLQINNDIELSGDIKADTDEPKTIFGEVVTNTITIGGTGSTVAVDSLRVDTKLVLGHASNWNKVVYSSNQDVNTFPTAPVPGEVRYIHNLNATAAIDFGLNTVGPVITVPPNRVFEIMWILVTENIPLASGASATITTLTLDAAVLQVAIPTGTSITITKDSSDTCVSAPGTVTTTVATDALATTITHGTSITNAVGQDKCRIEYQAGKWVVVGTG
jgi:hypothetical protein